MKSAAHRVDLRAIDSARPEDEPTPSSGIPHAVGEGADDPQKGSDDMNMMSAIRATTAAATPAPEAPQTITLPLITPAVSPELAEAISSYVEYVNEYNSEVTDIDATPFDANDIRDRIASFPARTPADIAAKAALSIYELRVQAVDDGLRNESVTVSAEMEYDSASEQLLLALAADAARLSPEPAAPFELGDLNVDFEALMTSDDVKTYFSEQFEVDRRNIAQVLMLACLDRAKMDHLLQDLDGEEVVNMIESVSSYRSRMEAQQEIIRAVEARLFGFAFALVEEADAEEQVAPLAEALGCQFTSISSQPWRSETFVGRRFEIKTDADLPSDLDERDLPKLGSTIIADIAAVAPRKLEMVLVDEAA